MKKRVNEGDSLSRIEETQQALRVSIEQSKQLAERSQVLIDRHREAERGPRP